MDTPDVEFVSPWIEFHSALTPVSSSVPFDGTGPSVGPRLSVRSEVFPDAVTSGCDGHARLQPTDSPVVRATIWRCRLFPVDVSGDELYFGEIEERSGGRWRRTAWSYLCPANRPFGTELDAWLHLTSFELQDRESIDVRVMFLAIGGGELEFHCRVIPDRRRIQIPLNPAFLLP